MTKTTTTVIFDLSEVLIQGMFGAETTLAQILRRDPRQVWQELNTAPMRSFFLGLISERQYWGSMVSGFAWTCSFEEFQLAFRQNFYELPGTRRIIENLKAGGFQLGLLSIHGREWIEYIEQRHQYRQLFSVVHYSYQTGLMKPEPVAFHKIMRELGVAPHQCLFIDDSERNIRGAAAIGLPAIRFYGADQLLADLRGQNIDVYA